MGYLKPTVALIVVDCAMLLWLLTISHKLLKMKMWHFLLSDPSPIIGNACHSLPNCRLVNLIDVTLACEDANSKLDDVVTVADVIDEDRVGRFGS